MNSPVLITGASGFLGSHLAEYLASQKVQVRLLIRSSSQLAFKLTANMELYYGDIRDLKALRQAMQGVEVVYHLAALLRGSDFMAYQSVNIEGTEKVCQAAAEAGVKRFIYLSSLAAVGPSTAAGPLDERAIPQPLSFYGQTKLAGEALVLAHQEYYPVTILRPGIVYGPREKDLLTYFKMVNRGLVFIGGQDKQKLSLIYVNDLVRASVLAAESKEAEGKIYFVSDGGCYSWTEIIGAIGQAMQKDYLSLKIPLSLIKAIVVAEEKIKQITGKSFLPPILSRDKIKEASAAGWECNNSKIYKELGFKAQFGLYEGVQRTVDFYLREKGSSVELSIH